MRTTFARLRAWQPISAFRLLTDISLASVYQVGTILFILLFAAGMVRPANGQTTDGVIDGIVTDGQGGALPATSITLRNVDTGTSRTISTGQDGKYRLNAVPAGTYVLRAEHEGFAPTEVRGLSITVGFEAERDFSLKAGGVEQAVTVSSAPPLIDATSPEAGEAVISQEQINALPIAGRQATQLSLLLPGTGTDSTRQQRPDANVGLGSANVADTNYLVDGLTNMISGAGDPRDNIQEASIQEFKVILSQAPAEYGGRSGGVVSLVTKGGTNQIHGEGFEFFRGHQINRVDYYTQNLHDQAPNTYPIPPFIRNQFGGAVGGPIIRDKLHFFASFERLDDREFFTVAPGGTGSTAAQQAIQQHYSSLAGSFRTGSVLNSYFGRLDLQANAKHSAFLRFFEQNPNLFYCNGCNGSTAAFSTGDGGVQGWTWAAGETWIIGPKVVNQFLAQVAQSYQTSLPPKYETPSQAILTASQIPTSSLPPGTSLLAGGSTIFKFPSITWGFYPGTQFHAFYQEVNDTLTVTQGNHTFKFGGDILNQPRKTQAASQPLGTWTFKNDADFKPNDPSFNWNGLEASAVAIKFTATYPTIPYQNQNLESAAFAQDEWKVRHSLTLSLGVRYDVQTKVWNNNLHASLYPVTLPYVHFGDHGVYDNVAPRVGFAWDVANNNKTILRAGYGIVYTMNSNNIYGGEVTTLRQSNISVSNATGISSFPDPYNGLGYQAYVSTAAPNISINDDRVSNPPVSTGTVGVTRQINKDTALILDAIDSKMTKIQISANINSPVESSIGVAATPTVRPLPAFNQISQVSSYGAYGYQAILARLEKRYSRHYQYTVAYTLAKQRDNYGNYSGSTSATGPRTDYYHPELDRGWAAGDRRNTFVLSGSTKLPFGITVGGIYTLRSALPLSATTGADNNGDGAVTDYVPGSPKALHNMAKMLGLVNAWRTTQAATTSGYRTCASGVTQCLAPINASQLQTNRYNQLDARLSKDFKFGDRYGVQLVGQLFNVFGTDNFGGVGVSQNTNASGVSSTFGQITSALPRQQGELAIRFLF